MHTHTYHQRLKITGSKNAVSIWAKYSLLLYMLKFVSIFACYEVTKRLDLLHYVYIFVYFDYKIVMLFCLIESLTLDKNVKNMKIFLWSWWLSYFQDLVWLKTRISNLKNSPQEQIKVTWLSYLAPILCSLSYKFWIWEK